MLQSQRKSKESTNLWALIRKTEMTAQQDNGGDRDEAEAGLRVRVEEKTMKREKGIEREWLKYGHSILEGKQNIIQRKEGKD